MSRQTNEEAQINSTSGLSWPRSRPASIGQFEEKVVEFFVDAASLIGVPKSVAAIYGVCFAAPVPLSFADIEQKLAISKGSISQGLRLLREMGALKAVGKPDDRCEKFEPDLELRKLVGRFLEDRLSRQLESGNSRLLELSLSMPRDRTVGSEILRKRLRSLQDWHRKARALLPIAKSFLRLP